MKTGLKSKRKGNKQAQALLGDGSSINSAAGRQQNEWTTNIFPSSNSKWPISAKRSPRGSPPASCTRRALPRPSRGSRTPSSPGPTPSGKQATRLGMSFSPTKSPSSANAAAFERRMNPSRSENSRRRFVIRRLPFWSCCYTYCGGINGVEAEI